MRTSKLWLCAFLIFMCAESNTPDTVQAGGATNSEQPFTDRFGDPLPDGAVARLGTVRWRYPGVQLVRFVNNGKQLLVCCSDCVMRISDAASGK